MMRDVFLFLALLIAGWMIVGVLLYWLFYKLFSAVVIPMAEARAMALPFLRVGTFDARLVDAPMYFLPIVVTLSSLYYSNVYVETRNVFALTQPFGAVCWLFYFRSLYE